VELREAVEGEDAGELRRAAHKLKGSCQNIGATSMATMCRALEAGADDPLAALGELEAMFPRTEAALRRELEVT
jgi:HPt (histidine-containing phosphotransfer) domain-containing protein